MGVARCLFLSVADARSLRHRSGHMVAIEFAVECRAFDAEDLGGFRFVPAGVFHRGEDMLLLDISIEPRPSLGRDYAMGFACSSTRWRLLSVVLGAKECGDVSALFVPTHKALWVGSTSRIPESNERMKTQGRRCKVKKTSCS